MQKENLQTAYKWLLYLFLAVMLIAVDLACLNIGRAQLGIDYADYYATGKMVICGELSDIYNMNMHHAILESYFGKIPYLLEWIYPPTFLLPIVPLSYFPFWVSLAAWLTITFIPSGLAVYFLSGRNKLAPICYLLFPGTALNIRWGQNGFLTAALIGLGTYFVESNPVLAGLMFGLLTFKPQMALIPFILLFLLKKWKALKWSCIFAGALALFSGLVFGIGTWEDFVLTSSHNASMLHASWSGTNWGIPTLYTSLRCMGLKGMPLYAALFLVAVLAFVSCITVWKSTDGISLRVMALVLCLFLSFPYLSLYDFAIFGIPVTLLLLEKQRSLTENQVVSFKPLAICLLWFLPLICLIVFIMTDIQLCPFILMGYMGAVVYKAKCRPAAL